MPKTPRIDEAGRDAGALEGAAAVESGLPPRSRYPAVAGSHGLSVIMPTVSWGGCFEFCSRAAIRRVAADPSGAAELVVVFDGPECPVPPWLAESATRVVFTGAVCGPARARNRGAAVARGQILLFVDADVELAHDALGRVHAAFESTPDLAGLFGAYDDAPACDRVVSQFRNLLHHHTHVSHPGRAATFWSGCGAIRRRVFDDVGGFDEGFRRPSVEDIDLGMRVLGNGGRIDLDPGLLGKHHKSWTLLSMIRTDVYDRAVPWTRLILRKEELPSTLNLDRTNRLCGGMTVLSVLPAPVLLIVGGWWRIAVLLGIAAMLGGMVWLHLDFYRLCRRRRGAGFAITSFALHWLFFLYSSLTFATIVVLSMPNSITGRLLSRRQCKIASPTTVSERS